MRDAGQSGQGMSAGAPASGAPPDLETLQAEWAAQREELALLRTSHRRLSLVVEAAEEVIFLYRTHPTPGYEYVSPSVTTVTGYTPEEFYANAFLARRLVHPDDQEDLDQARASNGPSGASVVRWLCKSGESVWVELRWKNLTDAEGHVFGRVGIARDVTDRQRIDAALRASEARHRAIFEHSPMPKIVFDPVTMQVLAVNQSAERHYGYTHEEFRGLRLSDLRPPSEHERFLAQARTWPAVSRTSGPWLHRMKDGTPLSVMVASQPMHFEGHEVRLATVTDITDRLKAENDFRASEARLLALLGCARGIAFEFDADCRYVNLWTGDYSLMAAPRDQVIGRTVTEILGPEIGLAFSERVQLVLRGGDPESFEYQLDLPDGSRRWFSGDVHATPVVEGVQPTVVFFARDVTERKTAEAALERSESSFRMLIDQLPDGVLVHREGRILYANNSFSRMTGYAIPELVGHQLDAFTPPEEMGRISERLATLTPGGGALPPRELKGRKKDGGSVISEVSSIAVAFEGTPAILTLSRDVTQRAELQTRLMLAERMASVGTLAAGVAHEINNPLTFVTMNIVYVIDELNDLLARQTADGLVSGSFVEILEALGQTREGALRVKQIVRDLKLFSRADEEQRAPVNVQKVIESTLTMVWNEIRHRARLVKDFEPTPLVVANEARLAQVFLNLLMNAAHAIPVGATESNTIRVTVRPFQKTGVTIAVQDTGSGIAAETLPRIFDPFFTTKPIGVGTGLGLSICHNIVTELGGSIRVESEVGRGTTFTVDLPLQAPRLRDSAERLPAVSPVPRARLLVVDDEESICLSLRRALRAVHDVEYFTAGRQALDSVRAGATYGLILCDLMMPEMTGMDLHRELTLLAPEQARRMVFMTGGAFTPAARAFLDENIRPYLEKPLEGALLERFVAEALKASQAEEGPPG